MAIQPTQPQGIGGVLDTTFQLYKASIGVVWPLSLLMALIGSVPTLYLLFNDAAVPGVGASVGEILMDLVSDPVRVALALGTMVLTLLFMGAIYVKQYAVGVSEECSFGQAISASLARLGSLVLMTVLFFVALAVGLVLLLVPGFILMVSLMLCTNLVLFEGKGAMAALLGSHKLIWGNWWRSAAMLTVVFILVMVVFAAVGAVIGVLAPLMSWNVEDPGTFGLITELVFNAVSNLLFTPFFTAALIALYWDLKLRKEGGDLAARVGAINAT
jgi:hypothetical protein